jgi:glycosyltransferase involved in cell wall biosynthesis
MSKPKSRTSLLIAGAYRKSEAYPNVLYRIRSLMAHPHALVKEINCSLLATNHQNKNGAQTSKNPVLLFICHIAVYVKIILHCDAKRLYVPYPSIFLQFAISLLPKILRPDFIILDAFISLYDTIVLDRDLVRKESWLAKLLFSVERRAFNTADHVIVDTEINRCYYSKLYALPLKKFVPIPLATDETIFKPTPYIAKKDNTCRVLFIGTLIPLHGIRTIIAAIDTLKEHQNISFHIIGNGQDDTYLSEYASKNPVNFTWTIDWCSSEILYSEIAKSDICLGIFGSTLKTQRVCPYKIYHYARVGRAIITAKTEWTNSINTDEIEMPFILVDANDSDQLADQILQLACAPEMRLCLANKSREFYLHQLSIEKSTEKLVKLFEEALI